MKLRDVITEIEKKVEHKDIPINQLDSMLNYQRDIDMAFVEKKSSDDEFDEKEVDEVKVSVRSDGSYKVCDGQHTVAILKKRGWLTAPCELRYGMTIEEENDWFSVTNTKSRAQARKRTLTSQINGTYEKNKDEQDFYACIKSIGFKLDIYGEQPGNDFKIGCPAKLLNVYKTFITNNRKADFIECMDIVKSCFNGNPISLQWNFIRGVFDFYETYKNDFDRKRLVTAIGAVSSKDIKAKTETDFYTKKPSLKYAKVFVNIYNSNLSKSKRLKMSKLED